MVICDKAKSGMCNNKQCHHVSAHDRNSGCSQPTCQSIGVKLNVQCIEVKEASQNEDEAILPSAPDSPVGNSDFEVVKSKILKIIEDEYEKIEQDTLLAVQECDEIRSKIIVLEKELAVLNSRVEDNIIKKERLESITSIFPKV